MNHVSKKSEWQPEYSVHVAALDAQHRHLFSLLLEIEAALDRGQGTKAAERIIPGLIAYTQYHFGEEERLMALHSFPGLGAHKQEHEILTRRVLLFKKSHDEGKPAVPMSLLIFLREWLTKHILGTDMQYAEFFRRLGVS